MAVSFLDFEQPIAELEAKLEELGHLTTDKAVNIEEEMVRLRSKSQQLTRSIFANLSPWQITQLARHPQRPYALDYIAAFCTDFQELHGDRMYSDDLAIIGGVAQAGSRPGLGLLVADGGDALKDAVEIYEKAQTAGQHRLPHRTVRA